MDTRKMIQGELIGTITLSPRGNALATSIKISSVANTLETRFNARQFNVNCFSELWQNTSP